MAVSFSGQTGRTIEAARQASAFGHQVVGLTGALDSPLAKAADCVLSAEIPTFGFSPGTSTYAAMLVTLADAGRRARVRRRRAAGQALSRYAKELGRLPDLAARDAPPGRGGLFTRRRSGWSGRG